MSRKSTIITLCILGTLSAVGACCCCSGFFDPVNPGGNPGGHAHGWRRPGFFFWGGGSSHPVGTAGVGTPHGGGVGSSSPRGGFGATGGGHASGGGHAGGGASGAGG
jgi:hypothetical protein